MPRAPALLCDLTTKQVAQAMGMTEAEFLAAMPGLISARGFPKPDPLTGRIDPLAFDRWRRLRNPHLFPELTKAHVARDAGTISVSERLGRGWRG